MSDNAIGLYDTIGKTFYSNDGTGAFKKGNDINYDINYITESTSLVSNTDHTLYAILPDEEMCAIERRILLYLITTSLEYSLTDLVFSLIKTSSLFLYKYLLKWILSKYSL